MDIVKLTVRKASMLAVVLAVLAAALLMLGEDAYAFEGPKDLRWDRTRAAWRAETSGDGRSTIYYLKLYEVTDSGETKLKEVQLTNKAYYDFGEYISNFELQGRTLKFKVSYKFTSGYVSADSESGTAEFCRVELLDTVNEHYQGMALARIGDIMDIPDPEEYDDKFFGGWSADPSGSPLWNFARDKVTAEMYQDGGHLALYATWVGKDTHVHDSITFEPWVDTNTLPVSGRYYLVDDVYLRSTPDITGDLDLCLNGKTIHGNDKVRAMNIKEGADVRIFDDDAGEGSIQGNTTSQSGYNGGSVLIQGGALTLNSGKIEKGFGYGSGGNVSIEAGTFTMNGGTITGGIAGTYGAGVYVSGGTFTMNGGAITGNHSRDNFNPSYGGGVFVGENGTFIMNGGSITGNKAGNGGGVYTTLGKNVSVSGGNITGNTAYSRGGGVWYNKSAVNIIPAPGGNETEEILIRDNNSSDLYMYYYSYEDTVAPIVSVGAKIKEGSSMGVAGSYMPRQFEDVGRRFMITGGLAESGNENADAFFSNDGGCKVVLEDDGEAWLARYWKIKYQAGDHGTGDMSGQDTRVVDEESYTIEENGFDPEQYYEFTGWKAGKKTYEEGEVIQSVVDDYTFTAQWEPKEYTVTYDLAGGSLPDGVTNPETFTGLTDTFALSEPERPGYEFTGWTGTGLDGPSKEVTIPQGTAEDKEYTANWELVSYTITYRLNSGKLPEGHENPAEYTVETDTFTLVNPELRGYTFAGWVGTGLDSETGTVTIEKGSTGDRTYFANYEEGCPEDKHEFGAWETTIQPTCTQHGEKTKTCAACGAKKTESISPTGHDYQFTEWTWKGNETDGYTEATVHYACANEGCGKTQVWIMDPVVRVIEPTCTEEGKTEYKAQITHIKAYDSQSRSEKKYAKFTDALGHDYQAVSDPVAATCTKAGKEADQECSRCHDVLDGAYIPAKGHAWSDWEVIKPATETEEGEETRVCGNDPSHTEVRVIPVSGHVHVCSRVEANEASCTHAGNSEYWICDQGDAPCGRYFSSEDAEEEIDIEDVVIYPTGHIAGKGVRENVTEPTCIDNGTFEEAVYCTECGAELRRTNFATPALGHNPGEPEVIDGTPATCTEEGIFEESVHCKVCGAETDHAVEFIPATGHEWDDGVVTREATGSEDGERLFTCINCGETRTEVIPKIKAANTLKVSGKTASVKFSKLRKKSQTLKVSKVLKFADKGQGKLSYKKYKGNKKITINKTTGKVTVRKGLKKGKYIVKVRIQAAGDESHEKSKWKTVTFRVKVR